MTLTFDLLTLKVVSESYVAWATSVPILVFLGLSVLDLGPMYASDVRQTDVRRQTKSSLNAPPITGGHNNAAIYCLAFASEATKGLWTLYSWSPYITHISIRHFILVATYMGQL